MRTKTTVSYVKPQYRYRNGRIEYVRGHTRINKSDNYKLMEFVFTIIFWLIVFIVYCCI